MEEEVRKLVESGMIDLFNKVQAGLPDFQGDLAGMLNIEYEEIKDRLVQLICESIEN